ncbi:MAG: hypothetical protein GY865_08385 [candidate division Zixibacteria bacterium]|nr:hypothetical protein [candidate division Zixibacteria bacterium]
MLFIEIALIRWVSTESRIFAYVNNLVLLSCFLGIGIGCYLSNKKARLYISISALAVLILLIKLPLQVNIDGQILHLFKDIPLLLSTFSDSIVWGESALQASFWVTLIGMSVTLILFTIIIFIFIPLGQILGSVFNEYKNSITGYSINVIASILGIWCFALLSFQNINPNYWLIITICLFVVLLYSRQNRSMISLFSIIFIGLILIVFSIIQFDKNNSTKTIWTPYQKLEIRDFIDKQTQINRGYIIDVNNVGYMTLLNLSDEFIQTNKNYYSAELRSYCQYDIPYRFAKNNNDVLILGSGGGNDVVGALRNNAKSIDAVEIDPGIYDLGLKYHPEKPYSDPRVNVFIDDARSFMQKSEKKYDVISFGLLDAHTLSSNYNNTRIDHYVYTLESFKEASRLLKKDGILTVIFAAQRNWIERRIYFLLWEVFGTPPIAFHKYNGGNYGWGGTMYLTGWNLNNINKTLKADSKLGRFIKANRLDFSIDDKVNIPVHLTTDNWPYFYLEKPAIPNMHLCLMILLGILFVGAGKTILCGGQKLNWHFFFLGAAFLLLEFQNISKASLLFGSTWLVNGIIITAILILILGANFYVARHKLKSLKTIYILLIISIILSYAINPSLFDSLGYWPRSIIVGVVLNLPIFFAGIIFIHSFKLIKNKNIALGSNLLGAACGGILESLSFIIGIELLLLIVGLFYILSWYYINRE